MKDLIKFFIDLGIVAALIMGGLFLLSLSFENDSAVLFWSGAVSALIGLIRGVWLLISNGISPWGD